MNKSKSIISSSQYHKKKNSPQSHRPGCKVVHPNAYRKLLRKPKDGVQKYKLNTLSVGEP
jgi:hypothetical protein